MAPAASETRGDEGSPPNKEDNAAASVPRPAPDEDGTKAQSGGEHRKRGCATDPAAALAGGSPEPQQKKARHGSSGGGGEAAGDGNAGPSAPPAAQPPQPASTQAAVTPQQMEEYWGLIDAIKERMPMLRRNLGRYAGMAARDGPESKAHRSKRILTDAMQRCELGRGADLSKVPVTPAVIKYLTVVLQSLNQLAAPTGAARLPGAGSARPAAAPQQPQVGPKTLGAGLLGPGVVVETALEAAVSLGGMLSMLPSAGLAGAAAGAAAPAAGATAAGPEAASLLLEPLSPAALRQQAAAAEAVEREVAELRAALADAKKEAEAARAAEAAARAKVEWTDVVVRATRAAAEKELAEVKSSRDREREAKEKAEAELARIFAHLAQTPGMQLQRAE